MKTAPLLSIGMIFKNEERCLERCLKSLGPLREAIPCELVMADTGAEDGSRAIAGQYADEVFDFPWIDDFSAARNAVMDRCHGRWYLTIDCDEWLDGDFSELIAFLQGNKKVDYAFVIQRNYFSAELEKGEEFSDFHVLRIVRMASGERYRGAIHEAVPYHEPVMRLTHTILHHDGYFFTDPKAEKKKLQRNMKLLREQLKEKPENLRILSLCIDSGRGDPDYIQYVRRAVALVQKKCTGWEIWGKGIVRHAVEVARKLEMPEMKEWVSLAETLFPDSIFTKIDINYSAFLAAHEAKEWEDAIRYGEGYRKGMLLFHKAHLHKKVAEELGQDSLECAVPPSERLLLIGLSDAYLQTGQSKKALELLHELDGAKLSADQVRIAVIAFCQMHAQTAMDIMPALSAFYGQINQKEPNDHKQRARLAAFNSTAFIAFTKSYREEEKGHDGYHRPAYTAFAALADRCEAGRAAKIMMSSDPAEMRAILQEVEDWAALPIEALEHALAAGVTFPLEEKPLPVEVLDGLAARLTHDENTARQLTLALPEDIASYPSLQSLYWAQSLALGAVRSFDWSLGKDEKPASAYAAPEKKKEPEEKPSCTPEIGLKLTRRFAQVESALLPLLYTPQVLTEENALLLPSMHRWGLYCGRALQALDGGDPKAYLATLRRGLKACPGEKQMVQFLIDRFREDARPQASPELLALAEKVRAILAAYSPDNPAAKAIRESEAYKQVAWLIEKAPGQPMQ